MTGPAFTRDQRDLIDKLRTGCISEDEFRGEMEEAGLAWFEIELLVSDLSPRLPSENVYHG